jgi:hypothetical protein
MYTRAFMAHCEKCGLDMQASHQSRGEKDGRFVWCNACRKVCGISWNHSQHDAGLVECDVCGMACDEWNEEASCWRCGQAVDFKWSLYWD